MTELDAFEKWFAQSPIHKDYKTVASMAWDAGIGALAKQLPNFEAWQGETIPARNDEFFRASHVREAMAEAIKHELRCQEIYWQAK